MACIDPPATGDTQKEVPVQLSYLPDGNPSQMDETEGGVSYMERAHGELLFTVKVPDPNGHSRVVHCRRYLHTEGILMKIPGTSVYYIFDKDGSKVGAAWGFHDEYGNTIEIRRDTLNDGYISVEA